MTCVTATPTVKVKPELQLSCAFACRAPSSTTMLRSDLNLPLYQNNHSFIEKDAQVTLTADFSETNGLFDLLREHYEGHNTGYRFPRVHDANRLEWLRAQINQSDMYLKSVLLLNELSSKTRKSTSRARFRVIQYLLTTSDGGIPERLDLSLGRVQIIVPGTLGMNAFAYMTGRSQILQEYFDFLGRKRDHFELEIVRFLAELIGDQRLYRHITSKQVADAFLSSCYELRQEITFHPKAIDKLHRILTTALVDMKERARRALVAEMADERARKKATCSVLYSFSINDFRSSTDGLGIKTFRSAVKEVIGYRHVGSGNVIKVEHLLILRQFPLVRCKLVMFLFENNFLMDINRFRKLAVEKNLLTMMPMTFSFIAALGDLDLLTALEEVYHQYTHYYLQPVDAAMKKNKKKKKNKFHLFRKKQVSRLKKTKPNDRTIVEYTLTVREIESEDLDCPLLVALMFSDAELVIAKHIALQITWTADMITGFWSRVQRAFQKWNIGTQQLSGFKEFLLETVA